MNINNIIEKINDYIKNPKEIYRKPKRIIENFLSKLKRSWNWFYRSWNMYDWDATYLINMMVYKLKDIRYQLDVVDSDFVDLRHQPTREYEEYYDSDNNLVKVEKTEDRLASLDKSIEIGERILKDDYIHYTPEIQKWFDEHRIFDDIYNSMPEDLNEKMMKIHDESEYNRKKDIEDFFNIIRDNFIFWWS